MILADHLMPGDKASIRNRRKLGSKNSQLGLSLVEIMMALLLLTTGLLATIGLFTHLFAASTKGVDQTVALQIAESILDTAASTSPASWKATSQQEKQILDPTTKTTFHTRLDFQSKIGPVNSMGDGYMLEVEVWWWPQSTSATGGQIRQGYGRNSVKLHRFLYVQNVK